LASFLNFSLFFPTQLDGGSLCPAGQQQVLWLQVPVDHVIVMAVGDGLEDLLDTLAATTNWLMKMTSFMADPRSFTYFSSFY